MPEEANEDVTSEFAIGRLEADSTSLEMTGDYSSVAEVRPPLRPKRNDLPLIPGYEVLSEIARGGMGRVLAGRELALDREVAIKVLLPGAIDERFVTESKITARLPHPGIPPVYALGSLENGSPFLAMKLVHGRTLGDALKARSSCDENLSHWVQVFEQIAQAVGYAHTQGIVHRDLKPANVMVGELGEVQVMDWGLAKDLKTTERAGRSNAEESGEVDAAQTIAGTILGTPAFMAPEQARGEKVDARADVFALGGVLCSILTGRAVFTAETVLATVQMAAAGRTETVLGHLDACPADPELVAIAKQCLNADRDKRPADGTAVASAIADFRNGVESRLRQAETAQAASEAKAEEQRKRRKALMAAGGIVAAVLVVGIAGTTWGMLQARSFEKEAQSAKNTAVEDRNTAIGALNDLMSASVTDLLARQDKLPAKHQEFLEGVAARHEKLVDAIAKESGKQAAELRIECLRHIANAHQVLGNYVKAIEVRTQAANLARRQVELFADEPVFALHLIESINGCAAACSRIMRKEDSRRYGEEAFALAETYRKRFPTHAKIAATLALMLNNKVAESPPSDRAERCKLIDRGVALAEEALPNESTAISWLSTLLSKRAYEFAAVGDEPGVRRDLKRLEELHAAQIDNGTVTNELGRGWQALARVQWGKAPAETVLSDVRKAAEIHESLVARYPGKAEYIVDLRLALSFAYEVFNAYGRDAEAQDYLRRAAGVAGRATEGGWAYEAEAHAYLLNLLARSRLERGGTAEARESIAELVAAARQLVAKRPRDLPKADERDNHRRYAYRLGDAAELSNKIGNFKDGVEFGRLSLDDAKAAIDPSKPPTQENVFLLKVANRELAVAHSGLKEWTAAKNYWEELLRVFAWMDETPPDWAYTKLLGDVRYKLKLAKFPVDAAAVLKPGFEECELKINVSAKPSDVDQFRRASLVLGTLYQLDAQNNEALAVYDRAIAVAPLLAKYPERPASSARSTLVNILKERAASLFWLGRASEEDAAWRDLSGRFGDRQWRQVYWWHVQNCGRYGPPPHAIHEVDKLLIAPADPAEESYRGACVLAWISVSPRASADEKERAARRSLQLLQKAADAKYFASRERQKLLRTDESLSALRNRADFKLFAASIVKP